MSSTYPDTGFGSGKQPPPALAPVIRQSSFDYDVPTDLLAGIWREESGGNYPNVAVNSSGYGGLFGTREWNAPPQQQGDLAASILATGLRKSGGDVAEALSYYNSGQLSGGYTSVPGETTYGTVPVPSFSTTPGTPGASGGGVSSGSTIGPLSGGSSSGGGLVNATFGGIENDISGSIEELFLRGIELFAAVVLVWVGLKGLAAALRSPGATQLANQFYSSGRGVGSAAAAPFMGGGAA